MNRKAERQKQADRLSKVLTQVNQENTQAAMLEDTTRQYEQLSEQYAKTQAGGILKPKVKRSLANQHYNQAVGMMEDAKIYNDKLKRLKTILIGCVFS